MEDRGLTQDPRGRFWRRNTDLALTSQSVLQQYWAAVGLRSKLVPEDYDSLFNPISWHGETDGVAVHNWQTFGDPAQQLDYLFGPTSTRNQMSVNDPKFNADVILDEIEEFLTGVRRGPEPDRVLATVLSPTSWTRAARPSS